MVKRKILGPAELAVELRSNTPQNVRAFVVKENVVPAIVTSTGECTITVPEHHDDYGFRGLEDIDTKMRFLQQAWKDHLNISVKSHSQDEVRITFCLKS